MRMKYCSNCGKEINVLNPKFCPECGFNFNKSQASAKSTTEDNSSEEESNNLKDHSFAKPEITVDFGFSKPMKFEEIVKQGDSASREEIVAAKRRPHEYSNMSKEEIKKALIKECGSSRKDNEISEE